MSEPLLSENTGSFSRGSGLGLPDLQQRYRVLAKLGSGGMADVFLSMQASSESFSRFAVVKRMRALPDAQDETARMFLNEARLVASLSHPHVVKVFDLGWVNKDIAMAMEYIDGESLHYVHTHARRQGRHVPLPIILKLISEAAEALHYAHAAAGSDGRELNLIHRDVGLQNLLLTRTGYLKIIDFGVAKSSTQNDVTTPGLVKGKIRYFAPETLTRKDIDGRADLYALGLVLFELVTLEQAHPFPKDATLAQVYERITTHVLPPVTAIREDVPIALNEVVRMATRIDRDERYSNCGEFAEALREVARPLGGFASSGEVEKWFQTTFADRFQQRRDFERRAAARMDKVGPLNDDNTQFEHQSQRSDMGSPIGEVVKSDPIVGDAAPPPARKPARRWAIGAAVVFLLFFTASFVIRASMSSSEVTETQGTTVEDNLLVTSTPLGATVYIDGEPRGTTGEGGLSVRIAPGVDHTVVVRLDGHYDYRLSVAGERFGQRQVDARLFLIPESGPRVAEMAPDQGAPKRRTQDELSADEDLTPEERRARRRAAREAKRESRRAAQAEEAAADAERERDVAPIVVEEPAEELEVAPLPPPPPPMVEVPPEKLGPVTQSSKQLMARRIGGKAPAYPKRELQLQMQGVVKVMVVISPDGKVSEFDILEGSPSFKRSVYRVIESWKFSPLEKRGQRVETRGVLEIEFRLGDYK